MKILLFLLWFLSFQGIFASPHESAFYEPAPQRLTYAAAIKRLTNQSDSLKSTKSKSLGNSSSDSDRDVENLKALSRSLSLTLSFWAYQWALSKAVSCALLYA